MKTNEEIWKDIPGYEGSYKISSNGRLKSFLKDKENGKILSVKNKKGWYLTAILRKKGFNTTKRIHRLVAEAFIPNNERKPQVNHIDGNKQNNNFSNLEWCYCFENVRHAMRLNPNMVKKMNEWNQKVKPKTVIQFDLKGNYINEYINCKEASDATGICHRNIHQVAEKTEYKVGKCRKQAGGFIWKFK